MKSFDDLTSEALARLRAENDPTRLAAAWVVAVQRHLDDMLGDDPGDNHPRDVPQLVTCRRQATSLARALYSMTTRGLPLSAISVQFSVGCDTESTTLTAIGPCLTLNVKPSCSSSAFFRSEIPLPDDVYCTS